MTSRIDIAASLRDLLLAYEQLRTVWRRQFSLSANEEIVLMLLANGMTAPTDLSRAVGMTTAGMTNLLDRLESEGLVSRERHATDGRRVLVSLTKRGFGVWREVDAANDAAEAVADEYDDETRSRLARFLGDAAGAVRADMVRFGGAADDLR